MSTIKERFYYLSLYEFELDFFIHFFPIFLPTYRYQRFGYAFFLGVPSRWSWTAGIQIRWKFRYHTHWWNRSWKSASTCIPLVGMIFEFPLNLDSRRSRPFRRNTIKNNVTKSLISMNWQNKNLWLKFNSNLFFLYHLIFTNHWIFKIILFIDL